MMGILRARKNGKRKASAHLLSPFPFVLATFSLYRSPATNHSSTRNSAMKHRWIWLWPLSLTGLLVTLAYDPSWSQEPDKQDPKIKSGTTVIKDLLTGNEPRDLVRSQSAHKSYEQPLVKGKTYRIDMQSTEFD